MTHTAAVIRRYREADLGAVYDVCVRTADAGGDARGMYRSDDLMPDLFVGPYVFLEPYFAFVLDDGHRAVGYIAGTPDTAAFVRAYRARWIPRLAGRYPVPPDPAARPVSLEPVSLEPVDLEAVDLEAVDLEEEMIALHYRPERMLWPGAARYPAHLHIDLLPPFQGAGYGRALMETFFAAAAGAGASGVHVTVMAANVRAIGFYRHLGFRTAEVEVEGKGAVERNAVYLIRSL